MTEPASFPSIRCHLGDWAYFSAVLPFKEIASRIQRADEINSNPSFDEMIQRELKPRVGDIAEYLQKQNERFFNAIVVGIYGGEPNWFPIDIYDYDNTEPINLSEQSKESLGILQLSGGERLFTIDGQHRVEGIKQALREDTALESEELVVLFVAHRETPEGTARTRRLFTTLNKYAKPVTTNEIIALDEDDAFAIVTRMIVNRYLGLSRTAQQSKGTVSLVKFKGAQISSTDLHSITSIQTIYKLVNILAFPKEEQSKRNALKKLRPPQEIIDLLYDEHESFWEGLRASVPEMGASLGSDPADQIARRYRYKEGGHVLFRPVGQQAFARALRILIDRGMPIREGIDILAGTRLTLDQPPWLHVMWDPGRNAMNRTNLELAESLLLYMVDQHPFSGKFDLEKSYQETVGDQSVNLESIRRRAPQT